MSADAGGTLALVIGTGPNEGATVAALRLADAAFERGHRVTIYTYGEGASAVAEGSATAAAIEALIRRGVRAGTVTVVVDRDSAQRCAVERPAPGVVAGDGGNLWGFVRDADVVLAVAR